MNLKYKKTGKTNKKLNETNKNGELEFYTHFRIILSRKFITNQQTPKIAQKLVKTFKNRKTPENYTKNPTKNGKMGVKTSERSVRQFDDSDSSSRKIFYTS